MTPTNLNFVRLALSAGSQMEKVASADPSLTFGARATAASAANELMEHFKTASVASSVVSMVDYVLGLRDLASREPGMKFAADGHLVLEAAEKLATAFIVDDALTRTITATVDLPAKEAAAQQRLLGREYIAELTRILIG